MGFFFPPPAPAGLASSAMSFRLAGRTRPVSTHAFSAASCGSSLSASPSANDAAFICAPNFDECILSPKKW